MMLLVAQYIKGSNKAKYYRLIWLVLAFISASWSDSEAGYAADTTKTQAASSDIPYSKYQNGVDDEAADRYSSYQADQMAYNQLGDTPSMGYNYEPQPPPHLPSHQSHDYHNPSTQFSYQSNHDNYGSSFATSAYGSTPDVQIHQETADEHQHIPSKTIEHTQHVPVDVVKKFEVPVSHPVGVPVPQIIRVAVPQPYAVHVPVPHPIPVPIYKLVPQEVEKKVPITVEKLVPYDVPKPYKIEIEKHHPVHVNKPYPVHVPIYRHVYHHIPHQHKHPSNYYEYNSRHPGPSHHDGGGWH